MLVSRAPRPGVPAEPLQWFRFPKPTHRIDGEINEQIKTLLIELSIVPAKPLKVATGLIGDFDGP